MGEGAPEWLVEHDRDGKISREVFFGELRERFEVAISVAELIDAYDREYVARIRPDPDVLAALGVLRHDGWRIGVVTNGGATQRSKLARASLDDLIDGCCVSREFGVASPILGSSKRPPAGVVRRCPGGWWATIRWTTWPVGKQ